MPDGLNIAIPNPTSTTLHATTCTILLDLVAWTVFTLPMHAHIYSTKGLIVAIGTLVVGLLAAYGAHHQADAQR